MPRYRTGCFGPRNGLGYFFSLPHGSDIFIAGFTAKPLNFQVTTQEIQFGNVGMLAGLPLMLVQ